MWVKNPLIVGSKHYENEVSKHWSHWQDLEKGHGRTDKEQLGDRML